MKASCRLHRIMWNIWRRTNLLKKIIDSETNLFMIPVQLRLKYAFTLCKAMFSWRHDQSSKQQVQYHKVICHLGQMLRLGLEPITSANFFVNLFTCQPYNGAFKNDAFSKRSNFKTLFESLRFHQHFRFFLEWMTGENAWNSLCFETKTQKFGRSLKERCKC